jgi:hypothetical protein
VPGRRQLARGSEAEIWATLIHIGRNDRRYGGDEVFDSTSTRWIGER